MTTIQLKSGRQSVGRSSHADVFLRDISVSRQHAVVTVAKDGAVVRDLGSRNGTFIDDEKVEEAKLLIGQRVRFGSIGFQVCDLLPEIGDESKMETTGSPAGHDENRDTLLVNLTPAQRRVLDLLMDGLLEKQVATRLNLSQHTVHNHIREIYRVLHVRSRAELLIRCLPKDPGQD